jgi:hypothetical protein
MVRFLVLALVNIVVVGLVAMQAVPPLLAGCDMSGSCANGPGVMTWALAVGLPVVSLIGLIVAAWAMFGKGRAKNVAAPAVVATKSSDEADAVAPSAAVKERKSLFRSRKGAAIAAEEEHGNSEQAADASAQSRLSRVRATAEAEVEAANQLEEDRFADEDALALTEDEPTTIETALAGGADGESPMTSVEDASAIIDDEADDLPLPAPGAGRLRVIPFSMADDEVVAVDDGLDWLFDGQQIASPDITGFPWIVATIDRFCEAVMDDRAMFLSETMRGEAQAWRTAVAPLPRHEPIAGRDAHDFTGWANQCLSMGGGNGRLLVVDTIGRLRDEARYDPRVERELPAALLDADGGAARALSA